MSRPAPEPVDVSRLRELASAVVAADRFPMLATIDGDATVTTATVLDEAERVVEVSRMLSGSPDSDTARRLYRAVADCAVGRLRMWGKNQLAGLDFIEHRYLSAGAGFEEVCEGTRFGAWQDQACAMVEIAREMERIKGEGEPYGVAQFYRP